MWVGSTGLSLVLQHLRTPNYGRPAMREVCVCVGGGIDRSLNKYYFHLSSLYCDRGARPRQSRISMRCSGPGRTRTGRIRGVALARYYGAPAAPAPTRCGGGGGSESISVAGECLVSVAGGRRGLRGAVGHGRVQRAKRGACKTGKRGEQCAGGGSVGSATLPPLFFPKLGGAGRCWGCSTRLFPS